MNRLNRKCRKCGNSMKFSKALKNTPSFGVPDFIGDKPHSPGQPIPRGQTCSNTGPAIEVTVLKCTSCGWSITP